MNLLVHEKKLLKNTKKYWISNGISNLFKKGLIVNQCIMINILKLKRITMMKYIQIFSITNHQNMDTVYVYL